MYVCCVAFYLKRCSSNRVVKVLFKLPWVGGGFTLGIVVGALFVGGLPTVMPGDRRKSSIMVCRRMEVGGALRL